MKKILVLVFLTLSFSSFGQSIKDTVKISEIAVTGSYSATRQSPFSFKNLSQRDITLKSMGEEPAILLSHTPSISFYSDNGTGQGYIYYRLRGIDQTRINSTFNGIPLNEPEDQGVYYNNFPGLLNATSNIQLIRGAGLSKPGVSSYGGSIDFCSIEFSKDFSGFANLLYGSFNTFQFSGGINSPNFFIQASKMNTDGYRNNSFNDSWSTYYGGKLNYKKGVFKLYGFIGSQKNGMAWLGETSENIDKDPKYNSNTPEEVDDFLYIHNQASYQQGIFKATVYHTYLNGWYTTDMAHFDNSHQYGSLINRLDLQSNWLGTNMNFHLKYREFFYFNFGANAYTYTRNHAGSYNVYSQEEPWYYKYNNSGTRNELSPYVKGELKIKRSSIYGDVQYRSTNFSYDGLNSFEGKSWDFLNWSAGISLPLQNPNIKCLCQNFLYYGIGKTHREPTRNDIFGGMDDYDPALYNPIVPEQSLNQELGWKYQKGGITLNSNIYFMSFRNEIVLNGKFGPNSLVLHQNATKSFRSGLEVDIKWIINRWWEFDGANSFSYNRIQQDNSKFQPVLTPCILGSYNLTLNLSKNVYTGVHARFSGNSYIDFSNEHTLPAYALAGFYGGIRWRGFEVKGTINNVTNEKVLTNATMGGDGIPRYFVAAGLNGSISLTYKF